jgi:hypothetical protein
MFRIGGEITLLPLYAFMVWVVTTLFLPVNYQNCGKSYNNNVQGASVNRAILQHCFFWFVNTGVDAAIAILLRTLKRFRCNGAVDWSTKCFCCERV